jgi:hypothetical protein
VLGWGVEIEGDRMRTIICPVVAGGLASNGMDVAKH